MKRKRHEENRPAGECILAGEVLEHGVVRTPEGDYVGLPILAIKAVRPGSRVEVIVYEPVPEDPTVRDGTVGKTDD